MPTRRQVEQVLLRVLFKHGGTIKEFSAGQEIVSEMADAFGLSTSQRSAFLKTTYRRENRVKKAVLWHRLLFRAADALALEEMVSRPSETVKVTKSREWMLTEKGFDEALRISHIPAAIKESLAIKSYEVQKVVKTLTDSPKPDNYDPFDTSKRIVKISRELALRNRGFRQAVIEAYNHKCAVCGFKIRSPDSLTWEVEAAHIVPNRLKGRDDIWNGIAFCRLHHWAFDVGWFTLLDDFHIQASPRIVKLPAEFGRIGNYEFLRLLAGKGARVSLPKRNDIHPHCNAIRWHRQNIFDIVNRD